MSARAPINVRFCILDRDDLGLVDFPQLVDRNWTLLQLRAHMQTHSIDAFNKVWGWVDMKGVGFLKADKSPVSLPEWEQPLYTFLPKPPSPPKNTVTFILNPPAMAQVAAGARVPEAATGTETVLGKRARSALCDSSSIPMSGLSGQRWVYAQMILGLTGVVLNVDGLELTKPAPFKQSNQRQIWTLHKSVIETNRIGQCLEELRRLWAYVSGKATRTYDDVLAAKTGGSLPCVFPSNALLSVPYLDGQRLSGAGDAYVCGDKVSTTAPYSSILTVKFKTPAKLLEMHKWWNGWTALAAAHWRKMGRSAVWCTDMVHPGILFLTEKRSRLILKLRTRTFGDMVELLTLLARGDLHAKYQDRFKEYPKKQPLPAVSEGQKDHAIPRGGSDDGGAPSDGAAPSGGGRGVRSSGGGTRSTGKQRALTWKNYGDIMYVREDGDREDILFVGDERVKKQLESLRGMYSSRAEEDRAIADILDPLVVYH